MVRNRFIPPVALALIAVCAASAFAAGSSLKLSGAATNVIGHDFNWTISGYAGDDANRVVAWEQYYEQSGCAPTYSAELARESQPAKYGLTLWLSKAVHDSYTLVAQFGADNLGVHGICAYLINRANGHTYAHGGGWWRNVSGSSTSPSSSGGKLLPAAVGQGQCQAEGFADHSVVAQIAIANATCGTADTVMQGADTARGAAYSRDGFSCTASIEVVPGSKWASAWGSTYYAYSCANGTEQVAFNWGTDYTY